MHFTTKVSVDIETGVVLSRSTTPYAGPWELCKGDNSKAAMEQSNAIAQQQLAQQREIMGTVLPGIQRIIASGGMLPEQQAAMTSIAMNTLPQTYNDLFGKLSQQLTARGVTGGQNAGGGDIARQFGALGAQEAGTQANLLEQIQIQKGSGLMQALGLGSSTGQGFGQQGVAANATAQQAANAADQASTGFWGSLFGALGAAQPFRISK
jgi:hypothetical protein